MRDRYAKKHQYATVNIFAISESFEKENSEFRNAIGRLAHTVQRAAIGTNHVPNYLTIYPNQFPPKLSGDPQYPAFSFYESDLLKRGVSDQGFFMSSIDSKHQSTVYMAATDNIEDGPLFLIGYPSYDRIAVLQPMTEAGEYAAWSKEEAYELVLSFFSKFIGSSFDDSIRRSIEVPVNYHQYLDRIWNSSIANGSLGDQMDHGLAFTFPYGDKVATARVHVNPCGGYSIRVASNVQEDPNIGLLTWAAMDGFRHHLRNQAMSLGSVPNF